MMATGAATAVPILLAGGVVGTRTSREVVVAEAAVCPGPALRLRLQRRKGAP